MTLALYHSTQIHFPGDMDHCPADFASFSPAHSPFLSHVAPARTASAPSEPGNPLTLPHLILIHPLPFPSLFPYYFPMRRKDKRITDDSKVMTLLASATIGRLATTGPDGPMIKPVNFIYLDDCFYFHSALVGEKIEHIKADPRVAFQVERVLEYIPAGEKPCKASQAYECVIAVGGAEMVEEPMEKVRILNALMEKHQPEGGYRPVSEPDAATVAVIRVVVEKMTAKVSPPPG